MRVHCRCVSRQTQVLIALVLLLSARTLLAQNNPAVVSGVSSAQGLHFNGRFDEAIGQLDELISRPDLVKEDSVAIFQTYSVVFFAMGNQYHTKAEDYLELICRTGPCVYHMPPENLWPKGLRKKWYAVANAYGVLTCADDSPTPLKTIAIRPFDNHSIGKYKESLSDFGAGLAEMFQHDFFKLSNLKVVEREKIDHIIEEQNLAPSGIVDRETAVKAGKILGAHIMVFGSLMQLDKSTAALTVRAVSVETGEILQSVSRKGKPRYFVLVDELVEELCARLKVEISDQEKVEIKKGGTQSSEGVQAFTRGLHYESEEDYAKAYESFSEAYKIDENFLHAKFKMEMCRPLAGVGSKSDN